MSNKQNIIIYTFTVTLISLIFLSYFFLDKRAAYYSSSLEFSEYKIFHVLVKIHQVIIISGVFALVYGLLYRKRSYISLFSIRYSMAIIIAEFLKNFLKEVFGRYWINTWVNNNLSLIKDGVYGFDWFHGSFMNGSFPSGNISLTSAAASMIIMSSRNVYLRVICIFILLVHALSLYVLNWHYVSDMLGGCIVGIISAHISTKFILDSRQSNNLKF